MKYFVTGGAGFIGSTIVDKLCEDKTAEVTVFDNFCSGQISYIQHHLKNKNLKLIKGDLQNLELIKENIKGHDFVYHFAANPDISKAMTETDLDLRLGIIATYNLLESMRLTGVKSIAYSSGSGVYGDVGFTETPEDFGPLLPSSMYGACKLGAEAIISAFCHMFDMKSWIFRFANVVGKNQTHGVAYDFIRKLKEHPKELMILGDGKQSKSYIHVSDVVDAMKFVIDKTDKIVNVFNIATDSYITVNEIAEVVLEEMGLRNVSLQYTGGDRGWKGDVPIVRFDLTKIHGLDWRAKYNSKEAIKRSVREMLGKQ
ncbi:MAG: hypothetical protein A3I68_04615 [Candidatus Melainabacteria bacterium RIFCSPLOWO2_02_FULL_35_15]|nr:MAG: hypothetical protein A3F80_06685 [Candidatus Melainabacteria bacterium RIFCSPLOWO2_12_FULL_35_11]OGI13656.1 MAG: hypothetical protein A3I68_04615 [Candidatus Melainabacteria bacterium RIFCSPLOWO2_02_FULL_35_15]